MVAYWKQYLQSENIQCSKEWISWQLHPKPSPCDAEKPKNVNVTVSSSLPVLTVHGSLPLPAWALPHHWSHLTNQLWSVTLEPWRCFVVGPVYSDLGWVLDPDLCQAPEQISKPELCLPCFWPVCLSVWTCALDLFGTLEPDHGPDLDSDLYLPTAHPNCY